MHNFDKTNVMKRYVLYPLWSLLLLMSLTSCELVGDIFEAGMTVGVILVLAIIGIVVWLVVKMRR